MKNIGIDIMHDEFLGFWNLHVYLCLFYWVRCTFLTNHFSFQELIDRWGEYPWEACHKNSTPSPPNGFEGRDKSNADTVFGKGVHDGRSPMPQQDEHFHWTTAMAVQMAVHAVALLRPFIKD